APRAWCRREDGEVRAAGGPGHAVSRVGRRVGAENIAEGAPTRPADRTLSMSARRHVGLDRGRRIMDHDVTDAGGGQQTRDRRADPPGTVNVDPVAPTGGERSIPAIGLSVLQPETRPIGHDTRVYLDARCSI